MVWPRIGQMTYAPDPRELIAAHYVDWMSHITPILPLIACVLATPAFAEGGRSRDAVSRTLQQAAPGIVSCGAGFAAETVRARFVIEAEGNVRSVRLDGQHADDDVGECMKRRIQAIRFDAAAGPTNVIYPFEIGRGDWRSARASWARGTWKGSGQLSKKTLDGLLATLASDVRKCGEGKARTRFTIRRDGKVRDVRAADVDAKTEQCVIGRLSRVRFPAPSQATHVDHSFELGMN